MQNPDKLGSILSLFTLDRSELTGSEIAGLVGRPKSTVYRILNAIAGAGFLDHDQTTGRYRLGIRLASLGELARQSTSLQRLAHGALKRVTDATREMSTVMVLSGNQGINIEVMESLQALMLPGLVGTPQPLHASAGGKCLLAWRDPAQVARMFRWPLPRFTATTITDRGRFRAELARVRRTGYGVALGEHSAMVIGIGAPVRDHRDEVIAAMTVGCPRQRATPALMHLMARTLITEADALARSLGYRGPAPIPPTRRETARLAQAATRARR